MSYLDYEGLKYLWSKINMQDYPNNQTLMQVIEAIDETKPLTITHPIEQWKKMTFTDYELRELSVKIVSNGKLVYKFPSVREIKEYANTEKQSFWEEYLRLDKPHVYKVDLSNELLSLKNEMLAEIRK